VPDTLLRQHFGLRRLPTDDAAILRAVLLLCIPDQPLDVSPLLIAQLVAVPLEIRLHTSTWQLRSATGLVQHRAGCNAVRV